MLVRRGGEDGLTLVEMLVVLAIIGVAAGAVTFSLGRSGGGGAQAEAHRLAARLSLAADEALVTDRTLALDWTPTGYRFLDRTGRTWTESRTPALEAHALPAGLRLMAEGARPLPIGADAGGATLEARIGAAGQGDASGWSVRFDGVNGVVAAMP